MSLTNTSLLFMLVLKSDNDVDLQIKFDMLWVLMTIEVYDWCVWISYFANCLYALYICVHALIVDYSFTKDSKTWFYGRGIQLYFDITFLSKLKSARDHMTEYQRCRTIASERSKVTP